MTRADVPGTEAVGSESTKMSTRRAFFISVLPPMLQRL